MNFKVFGAALIAFVTFAVSPSYANEADEARASTGGAQTLDHILARQKGLEVDDSYRREQLGQPDNAAPTSNALDTLWWYV
jgi:hypothetical protein